MARTDQEPETTKAESTNCRERVYEAMVLSCIDPRMQRHVTDYLEQKDLEGKFSHLCIAGAAIGAVAPRFEDWHQTFWEKLDISLKLHKITRVIVIDHRSCGAALEAYGPHRKKDGERLLHLRVMEDLREQIHKRHPQLRVDNVLMDLEGKPEEFPDPSFG